MSAESAMRPGPPPPPCPGHAALGTDRAQISPGHPAARLQRVRQGAAPERSAHSGGREGKRLLAAASRPTQPGPQTPQPPGPRYLPARPGGLAPAQRGHRVAESERSARAADPSSPARPSSSKRTRPSLPIGCSLGRGADHWPPLPLSRPGGAPGLVPPSSLGL